MITQDKLILSKECLKDLRTRFPDHEIYDDIVAGLRKKIVPSTMVGFCEIVNDIRLDFYKEGMWYLAAEETEGEGI